MSDSLTQLTVARVDAGQALAALAALEKAQQSAAVSAVHGATRAEEWEKIVRVQGGTADNTKLAVTKLGQATLQAASATGGMTGSLLSLLSTLNPTIISVGALTLGIGSLIKTYLEWTEVDKEAEEVQLLAALNALSGVAELEESALKAREAREEDYRKRVAEADERAFQDRLRQLQRAIDAELDKENARVFALAELEYTEEQRQVALDKEQFDLAAELESDYDEKALAEKKERGRDLARAKMEATKAELDFYLEAEEKKAKADKKALADAARVFKDRAELARELGRLTISLADEGLKIAQIAVHGSEEEKKAAARTYAFKLGAQALMWGIEAAVLFATPGGQASGAVYAAAAIAAAGAATGLAAYGGGIGGFSVAPPSVEGGGGGGVGGGGARGGGGGGGNASGGSFTQITVNIGYGGSEVEVGRAVRKALDAADRRR